MENYPTYSYPDSGDSSPRSREIDFENPPPSWEEHSSSLPPNFKVKFMVSYGGKIQPRTHDNLLSYVGGETKILAADRSVRFSSIHSKLASLLSADSSPDSPPSASFTFKYQLPGEDLDALISVTNDDDLEHMMHEYDRMYRASSKPARLRLFIFSDHKHSSAFSSTSSDKGFDRGIDRDRLVDALNSAPVNSVSDHIVAPPPPAVVAPPPVQPLPQQPPVNVSNNVDFLFGLDKPPVQVPVQPPVQPITEPEMIHELNRLQISAQELHHQQLQQQQQQLQQQQQQHHQQQLQLQQQQQQQQHHQQQQQQHHQQQQQAAALYSPKSDEGLAGNYVDQYQKPPPQGNIPANIQQIPAGYWQQVEQHQNHQQQQPPPQQQQPPPQQQQPQYHQQHHQQPQQQPMYMMHAPPQSNMYHAPVGRPVAPNQGYYQVQRTPADQIYREQQPVYSTPASVAAVSAAAQIRAESAGYTQIAYDSATGRQVYYTTAAQGGVVPTPYQGVPAGAVVSGDMRSSGDGKVGQKVVPNSGSV